MFTNLKKYPELIVVLASASWGLFWLPIREVEKAGLDASLTVLVQFLVPFLMLFPFVIRRWWQNLPTGFGQYKSGILIGSAVGLYIQSIFFTDVARALILFYAMPAWGTILEVAIMKRPLTRWRTLSLMMSLAGMGIIMGVGPSMSLSINVGDIMALISGVLFAIGALVVRQRSADISVFEELFAFFTYGTLAVLAMYILPMVEVTRFPSLSEIVRLAPWVLLACGGFIIPVMWGVYWGSAKVDPGRLGLLLQAEALVGIISAALLTGEPFGWPQAIGAALVISAGLTEVVGNRTQSGLV